MIVESADMQRSSGSPESRLLSEPDRLEIRDQGLTPSIQLLTYLGAADVSTPYTGDHYIGPQHLIA